MAEQVAPELRLHREASAVQARSFRYFQEVFEYPTPQVIRTLREITAPGARYIPSESTRRYIALAAFNLIETDADSALELNEPATAAVKEYMPTLNPDDYTLQKLRLNRVAAVVYSRAEWIREHGKRAATKQATETDKALESAGHARTGHPNHLSPAKRRRRKVA